MPQTKIQQAFSKSAYGYDAQTALHRGIADKLLAQAADRRPAAILDAGCGTGYLTVKAKAMFPGAHVIGLDFAPGMLRIARKRHEGIIWRLGDIHHLPFDADSMDLLISNLTYQWARDLPKAFMEARRVLRMEKPFLAALFGFHTCDELFQCLEAAKTDAQFHRLSNEGDIREYLRRAQFTHTRVRHEHIELSFKDMYGLLYWLKSIGANNLLQEGFLGPRCLARATAIYQEHFGGECGIRATFEVIWIHARK